jgi:hypothetical protein
MFKAIVVCLGLAALSMPSAAQHVGTGHVALEPDSTVKKFAGVWEGSFTSDHGAGGMRLQLGHDSTWKASITFVMQDPMSSEGTSVRVEGNRVSWNQEVMGMSCQSAATLVGAALKGEVTCAQAKVAFELKRRE